MRFLPTPRKQAERERERGQKRHLFVVRLVETRMKSGELKGRGGAVTKKTGGFPRFHRP